MSEPTKFDPVEDLDLIQAVDTWLEFNEARQNGINDLEESLMKGSYFAEDT